MEISFAHGVNGVLAPFVSSLLERAVPGAPKIELTTPPNPGMGDVALPCFVLKDHFGGNPKAAAEALLKLVEAEDHELIDRVEVKGPYLNFWLNRQAFAEDVLIKVMLAEGSFGRNDSLQGKGVMVEFLSPNTNKPLHLGHMRNGALGSSLVNVLRANGANVLSANNINDRGIHIVQSMLAWLKWSDGETPESTGEKGDHFVGRYYVLYSQKLKAAWEGWLDFRGVKDFKGLEPSRQQALEDEFKSEEPLHQEATEMLRKWEAGDKEVCDLWARMNQWVYDGFDQTNEALGFFFDRVYFESKTYLLGRDMVKTQLAKGVGFEREDGAVCIDLSDIGLDKKLLLRPDGTSVYITQDVGLAATRFQEESDLDQIIYVVAREQEYHFKVLFELLGRYGYSWASNLFHRSYGMVNLTTGRMKSREGTIVDADNLLADVVELAATQVRSNDDSLSDVEVNQRATKIAIAALKYFLIQVGPEKDMIFNPAESVSFTGNTGPYIQYAITRCHSVESKASGLPEIAGDDFSLLGSDAAFQLIKAIADFPQAVSESGTRYDPSVVALALMHIARSYSKFYQECKVIEDGSVVLPNLQLTRAARMVMSYGLGILGIPVLERM